MDPRVFSVARAVRVAGPETRVAVLAEMIRSGPYRAVPIVDGVTGDGSESSANATGNGSLLGLVTEDDLLDAFLTVDDPEERARVRSLPARAVMRQAAALVTPYERASSLSARFIETRTDVLPVVDDPESRHFLGMVSRADLVRDLVRPFKPPTIGGMATPLGVYLTTGSASGGVGTLALASTGLYTFGLTLVAMAALTAGDRLFDKILVAVPSLASLYIRALNASPMPLRSALDTMFGMTLEYTLFLGLMHLTPLARYHAAEHQVVHAIERGEPLLPETVARMPRVHPRCSTNFVAGGLILMLVGSGLDPLLKPFAGVIGEGTSWVIGAILALTFWRSFGSFLQDRFTTHPATEREIESAIRAAHEVLAAEGRAPHARVRAIGRLWSMGFPQIMMGAGAGLGVMSALGHFFPWLPVWLGF